MFRSTVTYLICATCASVIMTLVWAIRLPNLVVQNLIGFLAFLAFLMALIFLRKRMGIEQLSAWGFLVTTTVATLIICLNHHYYIDNGLIFETFVGIKMLAVFLPLLCPPIPWAGWSSLAVLGVAPVLQYSFLDLASQDALGIQEPWITVIFVVSSGIIYFYRCRLAKFIEAEIEMATKAKALGDFAQLLLGAQHLLNTPLQTIETSVSLLTKQNGLDAHSKLVLEKSFARVRQVTQILSFADRHVHWRRVSLPTDTAELESELNKILKEFAD